MGNKTLAGMLIAAALMMSACATKRPPQAPQGNANAPAGENGAQSAGAGGGASAAAGANAQQSAAASARAVALSHRVVYFDFDSSEIRGEGTDIVAAHAHYLSTHAGAHVRLEGNTDPRGSREYNLGLGERRAQSVRRALLLQGASDAQISTVSYGEERPAVPGNDDAAWAKDRRVQIVYLSDPPPQSSQQGQGPQQPPQGSQAPQSQTPGE